MSTNQKLSLHLSYNNQNKAVFFDRDGVLNQAIVKNGKPYPPYSLDDLIITHDAIEALAQLKHIGFVLIGITNQPDVSRQQTDKHLVEKINNKILTVLPLEEIFVCYHDDQDFCTCRKPKPGLIFFAAQKYNINLQESFMIGDRWRDIDAGRNASCKTIWLDCGYQEKQPTQMDYTVKNLLEAVGHILRENKNS